MSHTIATVLDFRRDSLDRHIEILRGEVRDAFNEFQKAVAAQTQATAEVNAAHERYFQKQLKLDRLVEKKHG